MNTKEILKRKAAERAVEFVKSFKDASPLLYPSIFCHSPYTCSKKTLTAAKKAAKGRPLTRELEDKGIFVRWTGRSTMAEEMPDAYKDISQVVNVVHGAGISRKVAKLRPIAVVKG